MSRNRNKRDRIKITAGGAPVGEVLFELERDVEGDTDAPDPVPPSGASPQPSDTVAKGVATATAAGDGAGGAPEAPDFTLFIPIAKIDEATHQVWGRGAQEVPDLTGEILDWASSRPLIREWSENTYKRSQGKSKGNIRAMHQPIGAGILLDLALNDAEKAVDLGTEIVDDQEWKKCVKGVYTGFSMGGKYVRRWQDPANPSLVRYTGRPTEFSLVDAPAIPTATFKLVKANGETELRKFEAVDSSAPTLATQVGKELPSSQAGTATSSVDARIVNMPSGAPPVRIDPANAPAGNVLAAQSNPNATTLTDVAADRQLATPAGGVAQQQPDAAGKVDAAQRMAVTLNTVDALLAANDLDSAEKAMRTLVYRAVQDAPNLRHVDGGNQCSTCQFFRGTIKGWCEKFQFIAQPDWMCDGWDAESETTSSTASKSAPAPGLLKTLTERGTLAGIARKADSQLAPPAEQSIDPRHYADPANWRWCCDSVTRAEQSVTDYNKRLGKEQYDPYEWAVLGRRIARLAEAVSNRPYRYDAHFKQIARPRAVSRH